MRTTRPGYDDNLPWDSYDIAAVDPQEALEARQAWTNGVFTEYASCAAFSAMNLAFLQCGAPVDLCAAAADFAVDELVHVSLVSRLVMTMGGATPYMADLERVAPSPRPDLSARMRAAELAIKRLTEELRVTKAQRLEHDVVVGSAMREFDGRLAQVTGRPRRRVVLMHALAITLPPSLAVAFLDYLQERGFADEQYRDPGMRTTRRPARIEPRMLRFAESTMRAIRWSHKDVQACLGRFLTTPKPHVVFRRPRRPRSQTRFVADLPRGTVRLDPRTQLLYCGERFFLNGEEIFSRKTQRAALAQLADRRRLSGATLARRQSGWFSLTASCHGVRSSGFHFRPRASFFVPMLTAKSSSSRSNPARISLVERSNISIRAVGCLCVKASTATERMPVASEGA